MSSPPPPPPGTPPGRPTGSPPGAPSGGMPPYAAGPYAYSRGQRRAQRRLETAQARYASRVQAQAARNLRWQQRAFRRSVVGPILLLAIGILLLLAQTGHVQWTGLLSWYSRWWPVILVGVGALLLLEWAVDQRSATPSTFTGQRILGPGVGLLILLLAILGWSLRWGAPQSRFASHLFGDQFGLHNMLGHAYEWDDTAESAIPAGQPLIVHNPRGEVSINGSSTDHQVHVVMHKKIYAWQESSAEDLRRQMAAHFYAGDGGLKLDMPAIDGSEADLVIELPANTEVVLRADQGSASVEAIHANVTTFSKGGDVTLTGINGSVVTHLSDDGASVSGHKLSGPVRVQGRTGDLNFSEVDGALLLEGDFFGSTHLEHINGSVLFQTSRTHFEAAKITGELDINSGPDFQGDGLAGPVVLTTKNRNITFDRVTGSVQIKNRNGSVNLTSLTPLGSIDISNERGSVDVAIPEGSSFRVAAETRNGDLENDFGLSDKESNDRHTLDGTVGSGKTDVRIMTSDGGITLRKSALDGRDQPSLPVPPAQPIPPSSGRHLRGETPSLRRM